MNILNDETKEEINNALQMIIPIGAVIIILLVFLFLGKIMKYFS